MARFMFNSHDSFVPGHRLGARADDRPLAGDSVPREGPRLLMYSQDGTGLGHVRRATNIADEVLKRRPESNVLILVDSPATPFWSPRPGLDYLKLPTIVKTGDLAWRAGTLSLGIGDAVKLRSKVILQAFREFSPDLVLVDHMPVGALGELKPMLNYAAKSLAKPKLFLGLRDILGASDVIRAVWRRWGAYEYLRHYDAVLIYGCREIYDARTAYDLTPNAAKVVDCHYVGPPPRPAPSDESIREPFTLVTGGGGRDAFPLAKAFIQALPLASGTIPPRTVLVTGPNMPAANAMALRAGASGHQVELVSSADMTTYLPRAEAVVTMAGYNSLSEVLRWRRKALVVPRAGPSAEQAIRARLFSQRRLVRVLDPADLTPKRLAEELRRLVSDEAIPDPGMIPPLDGAQRAADLLLGDSPNGAGEADDDLPKAYPHAPGARVLPE
jgi:predicted glycosyltransferase